jgi:hypothetical protein
LKHALCVGENADEFDGTLFRLVDVFDGKANRCRKSKELCICDAASSLAELVVLYLPGLLALLFHLPSYTCTQDLIPARILLDTLAGVGPVHQRLSSVVLLLDVVEKVDIRQLCRGTIKDVDGSSEFAIQSDFLSIMRRIRSCDWACRNCWVKP